MNEYDNNIEFFKEQFPSLDSYWRAIILFGKNTATYKFALAKSIISFAKNNFSSISVEELAVPYYKNICEHIKNFPKQTVSKSSTFLESCK